MRLLIHDYAGHPFPIELSRALAARGHEVLHVYSASNTTPQGELIRRPDDASTFHVASLSVGSKIDKNSLFKRRGQEIAHGRLVVQEINRFKPDAVLSGSTPLDTQAMIQKACQVRHTRFVFWLQDLTGIATHQLLREKLPIIGSLAGIYYTNLERALLQKSDAVVAITEDFRQFLEEWQVPPQNIHIVENWGPLNKIPVLPKVNLWSSAQGISEKFCFVYSGTLGMKHNPALLLELARYFKDDAEVQVLVLSEGSRADWLREKQQEEGLTNLKVLPFQPFPCVPQVLASADVMVAILESSAGVYSVPSKVLTYLCVGRPVLLSVPLENLSAKIVTSNQVGLVASPDDITQFVASAKQLREDAALRSEMGCNARHYAETHFDIAAITDKFEKVLCQ